MATKKFITDKRVGNAILRRAVQKYFERYASEITYHKPTFAEISTFGYIDHDFYRSTIWLLDSILKDLKYKDYNGFTIKYVDGCFKPYLVAL